MAFIDKIYGNRKQYFELRRWLWKTGRKSYLDKMYHLPRCCDEDYIFAISNFRVFQDKDLYQNCPLEFIKVAIQQQYGLHGEDLK